MTDNELIAEFMGLQRQEANAHYNQPQYWESIKGKVRSGFIGYPDQLKYDTSWDWLMPVVEKIESLKLDGHRYCVDILLNSCVITVAVNNGTSTKKLGSSYLESKIDSVYRSVVQFIKWYNENKKQ